MRCYSCNRKVFKTSAFCVHCGADLREKPTDDAGSDDEGQPESGAKTALGESRQENSSGRRTMAQNAESAGDLAFGQVVIIAARWVLIFSGLLLALVSPAPDAINALRILIVVILGLAVANFYLHTQVLMKRPVLAPVIYAASIADLVAITLIVLAKGGAWAPHYVFYFPAILAFSVAFRPLLTLAFAGTAIAIYALAALFTLNGIGPDVVVVRVVMLAAVAGCGSVYWGIEGKRRREAEQVRESLKAQIQQVASGSTV